VNAIDLAIMKARTFAEAIPFQSCDAICTHTDEKLRYQETLMLNRLAPYAECDCDNEIPNSTLHSIHA